MNRKLSYFLIAIILIVAVVIPASAQLGIGTNTPNPSAALDIVSTTQGVLHPRLTTAQRNAIGSPAEGLTIYNTTDKCLQVWDGTAWKCAVGGSGTGGGTSTGGARSKSPPSWTNPQASKLTSTASSSAAMRTDSQRLRRAGELSPIRGHINRSPSAAL